LWGAAPLRPACAGAAENPPFPFGDLYQHLIHRPSSMSPPESSSKTASRSLQPFLYWSQMLCCTMHCQTPKTAPFSWDFVTPPEVDRATAIGNMHENGKDRACGSGDSLCSRTDRLTERHTHTQRDRQTHTDVLITILRHRSRGRSHQLSKPAVLRYELRLHLYTHQNRARHIYL